jgi:hypothetical protein
MFLAPHTSGPRDVPQCGALSLLQKKPHYRVDPAETAARLNAKLWTLVTGGGGGDGWWHLAPFSRPILYVNGVATGGGILPPFLAQSFM